MNLAKATPEQMMRAIYRQERGIPERIIAVYLKCEEHGLVIHDGDAGAGDRASIEAYARRLFHDGMSRGWLYEPAEQSSHACAATSTPPPKASRSQERTE